MRTQGLNVPQILPGLLNMQILYRYIRIYLPTSFIEKRFGSDNFADYMRKAPGTYVHVGSTDGERTAFPHHNEHFDIAEDRKIIQVQAQTDCNHRIAPEEADKTTVCAFFILTSARTGITFFLSLFYFPVFAIIICYAIR